MRPDLADLTGGQRARRDALGQGHPRHQLQHQKRPLPGGAGLVGAGIEHRDQPGMAQTGQQPDLVLLPQVRTRHARLGAEHFDGHRAIEALIAGLIHLRHATAAQHLLQAVPAYQQRRRRDTDTVPAGHRLGFRHNHTPAPRTR